MNKLKEYIPDMIFYLVTAISLYILVSYGLLLYSTIESPFISYGDQILFNSFTILPVYYPLEWWEIPIEAFRKLGIIRTFLIPILILYWFVEGKYYLRMFKND